MKMTKQELKNIINQGWSQRRAAVKERLEKTNRASKKWQQTEKNPLYGDGLHMETVRRFKHYLGNGPVRNM